jgi:ABC-type phosphate transport system substrate-binding protein
MIIDFAPKFMKHLILVVVVFLSVSRAAIAQVAIIVHKTAPAESLSKAQVIDFYSADIKLWSNKAPVVIFDLKPSGEVKETFYKFLGKTPSRMKSIWLKKLLMGEGEPPQALASEEEMVKKVASTPGAIGFASKAKVDGNVKIVLIIDKEMLEK